VHRSRRLVLAAALVAALVLPASTVSAATTITYQLTGTASTAIFSSVSLAGAAKAKPGRESGRWSAVVSHDLGAVLGGTFSLTSRARTFDGQITGGTFGPSSGDCTRSTIPVRGTIAGGSSFDVVVTRDGSLVNGSCVVTSSTVAGTATLVYP
jgi:predicted secreted Zn-dependent protease